MCDRAADCKTYRKSPGIPHGIFAIHNLLKNNKTDSVDSDPQMSKVLQNAYDSTPFAARPLSGSVSARAACPSCRAVRSSGAAAERGRARSREQTRPGLSRDVDARIEGIHAIRHGVGEFWSAFLLLNSSSHLSLYQSVEQPWRVPVRLHPLLT